MGEQIYDPAVTFVPLDSVEVACESSGDGSPAIVLLHGLGASTRLWRDVQARFAGGNRVLSLDLRGAGRTRELEDREFSLETWSGDLRETLAALEIERPVLVGHSLGASVALKYALRFPEGISGLVLMGVDPDLSNLAPRMLAAADLIERVGLATWVSDHWSKNTPFAAAALARSPDILERYSGMLLGNDEASYVRTCRAIAASESLAGRVGDISLPALVILGAEDDRTLPEHSRSLARQLGDARVVELAGVGHTMPFEAPDDVAEALLEFVAELSA